MKNFILTIAIVSFACSHCVAQRLTPDEKNVQNVIHVVFEAFSEGSMSKLETVLTKDAVILEHGEVWTLDTVRVYFSKPRPEDFKRINTLEFFQTEVTGDMAFVSYHNTAAIHANGKDRVVKWLESAVLVKEGKNWNVKMLHSTRLQQR